MAVLLGTPQFELGCSTSSRSPPSKLTPLLCKTHLLPEAAAVKTLSRSACRQESRLSLAFFALAGAAIRQKRHSRQCEQLTSARSAIAETEEPTDFHSLRFRGVRRLFGASALETLRTAHVAVLGIGGVGSWVVEGLARSGVGALTLVDLDDICVSNTNRQLHTLQGTVGKLKTEVMAERVKQINPECRITTVHDFFVEETESDILDASHFDAVVDAIDSVAEKCRLIHGCRTRGIPVVVSGALGGKVDPSLFCEADITKVEGDGLIRCVRSMLRSQYDYPAGNNNYRKVEEWNIPVVFSREKPKRCSLTEDGDDLIGRKTCDNNFGTFCPAAGSLGLTLSAAATKIILSGASDKSTP